MKYISIFLFVILSAIVFSAPTTPPVQMPDVIGSNQDNSDDNTSTSVSNTSESVDDEEIFVNQQTRSQQDDVAQTTSQPVQRQSEVDTNESSMSFVFLIIIFNTFIIIFFIIGFFLYLRLKSKPHDSITSNQKQQVIRTYIQKYKSMYPLASLKNALIQQGFTQTDIDQVLKEVK